MGFIFVTVNTTNKVTGVFSGPYDNTAPVRKRGRGVGIDSEIK